MISKRLILKRAKLNLHNAEIYPDDENMVSAIAHNRRNSKKNKYLIPGETKRSKEAKNYVSTMASRLKFDSPQYFLWGNEKEIYAYAGSFFELLIRETLDNEDKNKTTATQIYHVLTDYIPFAMASFYVDVSDDFAVAQFLIDTKYKVKIADWDYQKNMAIVRLYQKIDFVYIQRLENFLYKLTSTQKLDKKLSDFVSIELLPILQESVPSYSIGNEAKGIMERHYKRMLELFDKDLMTSPEARYYHEDDTTHFEEKIVSDLVKAGSQYVDNLAKIQAKNEETIDMTKTINRWKPELCLK